MENSTGKVVDIRKYKKVNNASPKSADGVEINNNLELRDLLNQITHQLSNVSGDELGDLIIKTIEIRTEQVNILTRSYAFEELTDQHAYLNSHLIGIKPDYVNIVIGHLLSYIYLIPLELSVTKRKSILDKLNALRLAILDNAVTELYRTSGLHTPTISLYLDIGVIGGNINDTIMLYEIRVRVTELFINGDISNG